MAKALVSLEVNDSGFNQKLKNAAKSMKDFGTALYNSANGIGVFNKSMQVLNATLKANAIVMATQLFLEASDALIEWATGANAAAAAAEELEKKQEESRKAFEEMNKTIVSSSAQYMSTADRIVNLRTEYMTTTDEISKTNVLKQAQQEFNKLGIECKGLSDAQDILVNKGKQVADMIRLQGDMAALSALRMKEYQKAFEEHLNNGKDIQYSATLAGIHVFDYDKQIAEKAKQISSAQSALPMKKTGKEKVAKTEEQYAADSIRAQVKLVEELRKKYEAAGAAVRDGYLKQLGEAEYKLSVMRGGFDVSRMSHIENAQVNWAIAPKAPKSIDIGMITPLRAMEDRLARLQELQSTVGGLDSGIYKDLGTQIEALKKEISDFKGETDKSGAGNLSQMASGISQMTGGISSIAGGIEQLGIDIPEGLDKVVNTLGGISTIISGIASTVTAIGVLSAFPFRNGGIVPHAAGGWQVPGHDYSDRTPVLVSSGELILNRAQQGNLASQLGGGIGDLNLTAEVDSEKIIFAVNNRYKRTGRGEIVTTNRRRQRG